MIITLITMMILLISYTVQRERKLYLCSLSIPATDFRRVGTFFAESHINGISQSILGMSQ
jgi:hypothetical protein